jgi:hypothetical protein
MGIGRRLFDGIPEILGQRHVKPAAYLEQIEVIDGAEAVQLVEAGSYTAVFEIGKPADPNDEIGTSAALRHVITRAFHVPVREPQTLADPPQTAPWHHQRTPFARQGAAIRFTWSTSNYTLISVQ